MTFRCVPCYEINLCIRQMKSFEYISLLKIYQYETALTNLIKTGGLERIGTLSAEWNTFVYIVSDVTASF